MKTKKRILLAQHYTYLEKVNAKRVKQKASEWGSGSNYLNYLVAKDHDDKVSMKASTDLQAVFFEPAPLRSRAKVAKPAKKAKGKKSKRAASAGKKRASKKPSGKLLKSATRSGKKKNSKRIQLRTSKPTKLTVKNSKSTSASQTATA